ncbi:unnamed protein product [Absidia cylindrospora]
MTLEQDFKDDNQEQQHRNAFHVVLVDIEKAANDHIIHCVERPLEGEAEDVGFVALSYRWGKCQKTLIDTNLGYSVSITSFHLESFYKLCSMMTREPDLKSIKYVWVDAICVVDPTNDERRKATTSIYERANYILAVPDLHFRHLNYAPCTTSHWWRRHHGVYIYHLIQGNTDQLVELDNAFIDAIHIPNDPPLRHLLKTYTHFFSDGYTTLRKRTFPSDTMSLRDHIYEKATGASPCAHQHRQDRRRGKGHRHRRKQKTQTIVHNNDDDTLAYWQHPCDDARCPCHYLAATMAQWDEAWSRWILERQAQIQQTLQFLTDRVMDWSCQVLVIRDCLIAKKKNNLKFWFNELALNKEEDDPFAAFFQFDFVHRTAFFSAIQKGALSKHDDDDDDNHAKPLPIEQDFHRMMIKELNPLTFIEMILKPYTSKNDDRFQVLLPFSKYKSYANQAADWNISSRKSVLLKLYEIMDMEDKLTLLFLLGNTLSSKRFESLPTFATSAIDWTDMLPETVVFKKKCYRHNFDPDHASNVALTLTHENRHCLCITPREYFIFHPTQVIPRALLASAKKTNLFSDAQLELDYLGNCLLDLVSIASFFTRDMMKSRSKEFYWHRIYLLGSFVENKWVLCSFGKMFDRNDWKYHANDEDQCIHFNLY